MEERGKLIRVKFNGIRETFNATKRSNRARSFLPTTSIIKKDADSDLNDYHRLLTFFPSFFSKFTSSSPKLTGLQFKPNENSKKTRVRKKKKKKLRIPLLFKEYLRHLHKDGIDAEQLLEPRAISRKRREKFKQSVFRGLKLLRPARPCPSSIFPSSENLSAATRPSQDKERRWPGGESYIATEIEASLRAEPTEEANRGRN